MIRACRPYLLVRGMGRSWWHWVEQVDELSRFTCVIAVNLPGFGDSRTAGWQRGATMATVLGEVVRALDLVEVTAVGHSMGGLLVCDLALAEPTRVPRVALVAGTLETVSALASARTRAGALPISGRRSDGTASSVGAEAGLPAATGTCGNLVQWADM